MTRSPKSMIDEQGEVRELSERDLKHFRPAHKAMPASLKAKLGVRGPQKAQVKQKVTIRLNHETVEYFKETGKGWQTRVDDMLSLFVLDERAHKPKPASEMYRLLVEAVAARHAAEITKREPLYKVLRVELSDPKKAGELHIESSWTKHDLQRVLIVQHELLSYCKAMLNAVSLSQLDQKLLEGASGIPDPSRFFDDYEPQEMANTLRAIAANIEDLDVKQRA